MLKVKNVITDNLPFCLFAGFFASFTLVIKGSRVGLSLNLTRLRIDVRRNDFTYSFNIPSNTTPKHNTPYQNAEHVYMDENNKGSFKF